jgi:hypothetical protein
MLDKYFNPTFNVEHYLYDNFANVSIDEFKQQFMTIVNTNTTTHTQKTYIVNNQECGQIKFIIWKLFSHYSSEDKVLQLLNDLDENFVTYMEIFTFLNPQ